MPKPGILRDAKFEELMETRVDTKRRISLGKVLTRPVTSFRIYRNAHGQIVLDPMVSIPAHEAWLFKNKRAAALVRRGLADATRGRLAKTTAHSAKRVPRKH